MNKKGTSQTIITVVGISIVLVFLAVVLIAIFCPECLGPSIAAASERIVDPILSGLRGDKFEKTALEVPIKVKETYDNILSALSSEGDGPCIATHGPFTENFKGFKITLFGTQTGIFTRLINEDGETPKSFTVPGKKPCVVDAKNFYNNYLKDKICKSNCLSNYIAANIEFRDGEHIYFNDKNAEFEDGNIVFKTKDGNVCFFPIDIDSAPWSGSCVGRDDHKIDHDCIKIIKEKLDSC